MHGKLGAAGACLILAAAACAALIDAAEAETRPLDRIEHIHGLAVDPERPDRLYLATHGGLFRAGADGVAERVGASGDDLMSFTARPGGDFIASGHPFSGGNLGVLGSRDGGETWEKLSDGVDGPVDFHLLAVSPGDPQTVYGVHGGLQLSEDGGLSWRVVGASPAETFDLAVSALAPDRLYAATRGGLFRSLDGGASWGPVFRDVDNPATLVHVAADGTVYAFFYGVGLVASDPAEENWELRRQGLQDRYLLHMADDPEAPGVLYAIPDTGAVLTSADGGRSWTSFVGHDRQTPERIAAGAKLYGALCQSCHGENGVGERPDDPGAVDEYGFVAPALDDSAHAWHHSDGDLVRTVLEGSQRNPRMLGYGEVLGENDAQALVAYIKSLWSFNSVACQGALHMRCMH